MPITGTLTTQAASASVIAVRAPTTLFLGGTWDGARVTVSCARRGTTLAIPVATLAADQVVNLGLEGLVDVTLSASQTGPGTRLTWVL